MVRSPTLSYVVGFLFRDNGSEVALILKKRPARVAGLLNGIGGKIEPGEDPLAAMIREFPEEAGVAVTKWRCFATIDCLAGYYGIIHCYVSTEKIPAPLKQMTDEEIVWQRMDQLAKAKLHPQLYWLLPMALDRSVFISRVTASS